MGASREAEELTKWREKFDSYDKDGSGAIDIAEMAELMVTFGFEHVTTEMCQKMMAAIDEDDNGECDFKEFQTLMNLQKLFESFDTDGHHTIDAHELMAMMESMGISATLAQAKDAIKPVDEDNSGEIDFGEFCTIVKNNQNPVVRGSSGFSFAGVIKRARFSGPPLLWRVDETAQSKMTRFGKDTVVSEGGRVLTYCVQDGHPSGTQWTANLIDEKLSKGHYSVSSIMLEFERLGGEAYVGVAGSNFNHMDKWNIPLGTSADKPGMAPWSTMKSTDGSTYLKGRSLPLFLKTLSEGNRVSMDLDMINNAVTMRVLSKEADGGSVQWKEEAEVVIDGVHPEVSIVVAFSSTAAGQESKVRIIGSSTEHVRDEKSGADVQKDEDEQRGVKIDEATRVALSTAQ